MSLSLGIQSYIDGKSWTLGSSVSTKDTAFSTVIPRNAATIDITAGKNNLATIDRPHGTIIPVAGTTLVPLVSLGKSLGYILSDKSGQKLQMNLRGENISYSQMNDQNSITTS